MELLKKEIYIKYTIACMLDISAARRKYKSISWLGIPQEQN